MKRSISQLDTSSEGNHFIPKAGLKRAVSESHVAGNSKLENDDGGEREAPSHLVHTNRELRLELQRRRRQIDELSDEVERCKQRSDEIEKLITIVDRAWIQLEKEVNSFLTRLGSDASSPSLSSEWTRLLQNYIVVNTKTVSPSSDFIMDEWATKGDIERYREAALENNTSVDIDELPSQLTNRIACVTQALSGIYSRLCSVSSNDATAALSAIVSHMPSGLTLPYEENILQLNAQIIQLKADLNHSKRELHHVYRQLDLVKDSSTGSANANADDAPALVPIEQTASSAPVDIDMDTSSPDQTALISRLRSELSNSEELRRKLEEAINKFEAVAPPTTQDVSNVSEQLRTATAKITDLINERTMLNVKMAQINAAQDQLLQDTQQRIESVIAQTEEKIARVIQEKNDLQKKYDDAQCDIRMISSYKTQASSYDALEASLKQEIARLNAHLSTQAAKCNDCEAKLIASRQREVQLESRLAAVMDSSASEEEGQVYEITPQQIQSIMSQAHAKIKEYEAEIADYKTNVNDLILEIETIVKDLEASKDVQKKLNEQIATEQRLQRTLIEDNIKLRNELTTKGNQAELEQKLERVSGLMKQQDQVIAQLRSAEHHYRSELMNQQSTNAELRANNDNLQLLAQEEKMKYADLEAAQDNSKKLISELRQRCERLREQYEDERQARLELCSTMHTQGGDSHHPTLNDEDSQMLDMTLSMLRCSVCKDRFKHAVITRCYHMFCKECIDENLKSRHRKCPACGEKFGQDDVRVVYFTH